MEELGPAPRTEWLAAATLGLLESEVWPRYELRGSAGVDASGWVDAVRQVFGIEVPDWVASATRADHSCCAHGDPTFGNVLVAADGGLRLIDPCHRVHAPESRYVDLGKIVQSCLGWETVHAGAAPVAFQLPDDPLMVNEDSLRVALWWTGMHALRIYQRERSALRRPGVERWAESVLLSCWGAVGAADWVPIR